MMGAMRVLERVLGEKPVHTQTESDAAIAVGPEPRAGVESRIDALTQENRELRSELARIKELLGIE